MSTIPWPIDIDTSIGDRRYIANTMAKKVSVNRLVERVWDIEGFPHYFFGADKQLYRYDLRGAIRQNKRIQLRYTQGYVLKSRFYSLSQLRLLLRRHGATGCPMTNRTRIVRLTAGSVYFITGPKTEKPPVSDPSCF